MGTLATHTPAQMMRDYVVVKLGAQLNGWSPKIGMLPPEGNQVIGFIDSGGPSGFPHLLVDYLGLQVLVRSNQAGEGYNTSYLMMRKIRDVILGMPNQPVEFPELDGVTERGSMVPLGYDDQKRHIWSWNAQLLVEPETNALTNRISL